MKKLNCNPGNYQCGGKCQPKSWKCSKKPSQEISEQLNTMTKLIKSVRIPQPDNKYKEELINFLNERKEKGIDKEPQIPIINEKDFNKIIQEGFKNKDTIINEPHLEFESPIREESTGGKTVWKIDDPMFNPAPYDYLAENIHLLSNSQIEKILSNNKNGEKILKLAQNAFLWVDKDNKSKTIGDYKISAKDMAKILNIDLKGIKPMFDPNEPNQKKLDGNWKKYGRDGSKLVNKQLT